MNRMVATLLVLVGGACAPQPGNTPVADPATDLAALRAADSAWQDASISRSADRMIASYAQNATADFGQEPIRGAAAIRNHWAQFFADTGGRLGWTMERAGVVPGASLGYTIGTYRGHYGTTDASGPYFAVWQRQEDGRWLVLIDTAR